MLSNYQQCYQEMLTDIQRCRLKALDKLSEIECCFQVATGYWDRLVRKRAPPFSSMADTITFYKELKPAFLAEIRYHELYYYVSMFQPTESIQELKRFWARETARKERCIEENKDLFARDPADPDRYVRILSDFIALERYTASLQKSFL